MKNLPKITPHLFCQVPITLIYNHAAGPAKFAFPVSGVRQRGEIYADVETNDIRGGITTDQWRPSIVERPTFWVEKLTTRKRNAILRCLMYRTFSSHGGVNRFGQRRPSTCPVAFGKFKKEVKEGCI